MKIGTIKEVKDNENRVGITPAGVRELAGGGHEVLVEKGAGGGAGFSDDEYEEAGAVMKDSPEDVVKEVEILVKVKEPVESEYALLELLNGRTLYTFLHLSGVPKSLTDTLLEQSIIGVAYETVEDENGRLPLLHPMSEVAGVLAVQYGAQYLQKKYHGRGVSLGVIGGADLAHTVVVGIGSVGSLSAKTAIGMGGRVTILNRGEERMNKFAESLKEDFGESFLKNVEFKISNEENLKAVVADADLVVGAVLVPGAKAPEVVTEEMVKSMRAGSVIVDVAIDQGGCVWGAKPTTHSEPIYEIDGKIFCCVTNMPGQVARQSTQALTSATLPYLKKMAAQGVMDSLKADSGLAKGLNTYDGKITYEIVAKDLDLMDLYRPLGETL